MKTNLSRMLRSGIAMLLVLCMVAGVIPSVVFATEESNEINYVSLGDSMTNGYCFTGYEQGNITASQFFAGEGVYGDAAYPNQFAAWLEETTGKTVNHAKLAVSAMRAEDLNYLLGGREMPTDGWFDQILHYSGVEDDAALAAFYQEKIENADVITMSVGNAAFGAYLVQYITRAMGVMGGNLPEEEEVNLELAIAELNDEQKALVMDVYGMAMDSLTELIPAELAEKYKVDAACDVIAYCTAGYLLNYKSVLEQIMELNPDVQIVLVGLMNTTYGMEITMGDDFSFAIGDFMDDAFGLLNTYMAGLPAAMQFAGEWTDAEFYYAAQPQPEFIVQVYDDLYNDGWTADYDRLSGTIVRNRTMKAYNEALRPMIGLALGFNLPEVTLADVDGYVAIGDEPDSYKASYLFTQEIAVLTGGGAPGPLVSGYLEVYPGDYSFGHAKEYLTPEIEKEISIAIYLALEEALASSVGTMEITVEGLEGIGGGDIFGALGEMPEALNPANNPGPVTIREALVGWFTGSETSRAMCKIFALFKVGDGMSVHPTPAAHDDIAESVIAAYGEHTAKDETVKNAKIALKELYNLMKEYGPDAAKQVWAQWEAQGYVAAVETSINDLIEAAKDRYAYYTESVLPALDAAIADLGTEKDALVVELAALKTLLAAKEAELADVLAKQEIGSVTVPEINFDITAEVGGNAPTTVPGHDCEVEGEGIVAELEAAIADLKHAVAVLEALVADANADIADMVELATQIAGALAPLGETVAQVVAAGEDLMDAFWAIREVLTNDSAVKTAEAVVSAFGAARSTALAAAKVVEVAGSAASVAFGDVDALIADVVADAEALAKKIVADVPASLAKAPQEVLATIAVAKIAADLARASAGEYVEGIVEAEIDALVKEATAKYEAGRTELESQVATKKDAVEEALAKLDAHVADKFPGVAAEVEKQWAALADMKIELEADLANLLADLDAKVAELANETAETIEAAVAPIKAQIARVEKDLAVITNDLACAVEHLATANDALAAYVNDQIAYVNKQIKNFVSAAVSDMKNAVTMGKQALADLVDTVVSGVNELLKQATTADLVVDDEFTYVALGDASATEGYAEKLAALYNEEALANGVNAIDFVNEAKAGNTVASVRNNLPASVAEADLITLGFSSVTFLANAIANADRDWAEIVGEENIPYVVEIMDKIADKIAESGLAGDTAALAKNLIEGFAYSAVEYAVELPKLIGDIAAINPDAVVVIVGMYNPLKDTTFVFDGTTIEISEYVDYMVEAIGIHGLVYSLISGDSIYVDVEDVATINTKTELNMTDLFALIGTGFAALNPSEAGNETIMVALANALNVTYVPTVVDVLYGDVNDDGVVDGRDLVRLAQYDAGYDVEINERNADANADGVVDGRDLVRLAQYDAGYDVVLGN